MKCETEVKLLLSWDKTEQEQWDLQLITTPPLLTGYSYCSTLTALQSITYLKLNKDSPAF